MNSLQFLLYFKDKKEHYPISDEFIENYQQLDDGREYSYITIAHKVGHPVDKKAHEPNQKWHLYESYLGVKLGEKKSFDFNIMGFHCPELLLWLAEASGIDGKIVQIASEKAKEKIDEVRRESSKKPYSYVAANYMNDEIEKIYGINLWKMIVEKIESEA